MKCKLCGITIPELPEDARWSERLCDTCFENQIKDVVDE